MIGLRHAAVVRINDISQRYQTYRIENYFQYNYFLKEDLIKHDVNYVT